MTAARFPVSSPAPATAADSGYLPRLWSWLAGLNRPLRALARHLRTVLPGARSATIPIAVLCDVADPAGQRRLREALRAGLRGAERALAGWPDLAITVAVLETVGTPGRADDLGALVGACHVRRRPGGPRAVIRLATTADGRPLTDNNRLTALWLTLDWLLDWPTGDGDCFTVPYQATRGPRSARRPDPDLPGIPPAPTGVALRPPAPVNPTTVADEQHERPPATLAAPSVAAGSANGAGTPPNTLPADGLAWPDEPDMPQE